MSSLCLDRLLSLVNLTGIVITQWSLFIEKQSKVTFGTHTSPYL